MLATPVPSFESTRVLVRRLRPELPVFCVRPESIAAEARRFTSLFPGRVLYAVKCNPHPSVLRALHQGGIRHFDVASLPEIEQVRQLLPDCGAYFMHPVKDRRAIREAWAGHGVRHFVVDHPDELAKVLAETAGGRPFIFVRIATPEASDVLYHLASRFGAGPAEAAELLREARRRGCRTGITFHVGSQCLDPKAYRVALEIAADVIGRSGVRPECVDVGGGFPFPYPGVDAPPLETYFDEIRNGVDALRVDPLPSLWAEPGRALVAGGCSLVAQVKLRKDERLYINDGVYGAFSELIDSEQELPARLFPARACEAGPPQDFCIQGPTCDSMDVLSSTLRLPSNVAEGDWIEVDQLGAYSNALSSRFNGFALEAFAEVGDAPPAEGSEIFDSC